MDYKEEIINSLQDTFNLELDIVQPYHFAGYDFVLMHEVFRRSLPEAVFMVIYCLGAPLQFPNVVRSHVGIFISFETLQIIIAAKDKLNELRLTSNPKPLYTYIMYDRSTGYYKIGQSVNPHHREKTMQAEKPTIDTILLLPINKEYELHQLFKSKHIRGEWFSLDADDILLLIEKYEFKPVS